MLIVGGGPVGLAAAIGARLAGLTVTVIEPRVGPIDKACGEGLMPGAVPLLSRLGVQPAGRELRGIRYSDGRRSVEHLFTAGAGLGVRRTALHAALAGRAGELSIDIQHGKVSGIKQDDRSVTAIVSAGAAGAAGSAISASSASSSGTSAIRARWLLGCDGLHSSVAVLAGLAQPAPISGRRYGIRQHYAMAPWDDLVEVHYGPHAELYVTPVAADLVGIAVLGRQGAEFDAALAAVPAVADRLRGAEIASERRGAGPLRRRTTARSAGRVLLVGDASGYVDAITGEGLRLGFAQAAAAVGAIVAEKPSGYEREWRAITRDFRLLTSGLVWWAGSPMRGSIVPVAARLPRLFGAVVERLAR